MKMEASITAVEQTIGYTFRNKKLLEEALTHASFPEAISYDRLEFVGDAVLGLAISNHLFLTYTSVDQGQLTLLRAANVSTEKLARAAVRYGLHRFVRHNTVSIVDMIREFADAVQREDDCSDVLYGGSVKAPKILADIVESIAAAVYVDVDFDLKKLWVIIRGLLEPIVTLDDLEQRPQPVTMLFEICQKNGKKVDIRQWRNGAKSTANVYVDEELVASASSDQKDIARLEVAKIALHKLEQILPATMMSDSYDGLDCTFEIEAAKQKLYAICGMKKWPKPEYRRKTPVRSSINDSSFSPSNGTNGRTRIIRVIQEFRTKLGSKIEKIRKNLPMKLLFFLVGFYCATAFSTVIGQTGDWDILCAALAVVVVEGIGALMYSSSLPLFTKSLISVFNYWKAGLTLGLFLDSFKY